MLQCDRRKDILKGVAKMNMGSKNAFDFMQTFWTYHNQTRDDKFSWAKCSKISNTENIYIDSAKIIFHPVVHK